MGLRLQIDVVLDVNEWDEDARPGEALRILAEDIAGRIGRSCQYNTGCDLYGTYPVYRADGTHFGHWQVWGAGDDPQPVDD